MLNVRADMVNGHAICHGGLVFTLAGDRISFVREYMDTARGARCIFG